MITIKNPEQIAKARVGGKILAQVLQAVVKEVKAGVTTESLNVLAEKLIAEYGGRPSFKGYSNGVAIFPSALCISLNNEVVHGPAVHARQIHDGDVVSIDVGMEYDGMFTDMATTVTVGNVSKEVKKLLRVTKESLELGIAQVRSGGLLQDISFAIQKHVENNGFGVVRDLSGHGVGFDVHEEPAITNYYEPRQKKIVLKEGMMLAIEPMVTMGSWKVKTLSDKWTVVTADNSLAAHFEHTVVVTKDGCEVLTKI